MGFKPKAADSKEEKGKAPEEEEERSSCDLAESNQDFFSRIPAGAEILLEILSHLPPKEIFKIKSVSQGIHRLTENPEFSAKHYRNCKTLSGNLSGFFCQTFTSIDPRNYWWGRNFNAFQIVNGQHVNEPEFVPSEPESLKVPDLTLQFLEPDYNAVVEVIDSCNGLLLCCTYIGQWKKIKTCFVCNPLTMEHVVLPHPRKRSNRIHYALLADTTSDGYLQYKVVCVFKPKKGEPWTVLLIFSSEMGEWEEFDEKLPPLCDKSTMGSKVFFNGSLFWDCLDDDILVCHLNKKTKSQRCYELIEAPSATQGRSLWVFKDKLICNCHWVYVGFPAWSLFVNDDKELEWKDCQEIETLTQDVSEQYNDYFPALISKAKAKPRIQFRFIGYKPESNMIYLSKTDTIYTYNLKQRTLEVLWGYNEIGKFTLECRILSYVHNFAPIQTTKKKEEAAGKCFREEKEELERKMNVALSFEDDTEELMSVYENMANKRKKKKNRRKNAASH